MRPALSVNEIVSFCVVSCVAWEKTEVSTSNVIKNKDNALFIMSPMRIIFKNNSLEVKHYIFKNRMEAIESDAK